MSAAQGHMDPDGGRGAIILHNWESKFENTPPRQVLCILALSALLIVLVGSNKVKTHGS